MLVNGTHYRTVWMDGPVVKMIEQRSLPHRFEILDCPTHQDTARAIKDMAVRGAGAIGAAAGFAMAQGVIEAAGGASDGEIPSDAFPDRAFLEAVERAAETIRSTRPTAHDLFFSVAAVLDAIKDAPSAARARELAVAAANRLADENASAGERMGAAGVELIRPGMKLLTHCNAGWLAFVDWGSALAPVYAAQRQGKDVFVYTGETRPRSQGAKLTDWELTQAGVPHRLVADTAVGLLFARGEIDAVIVGADRIAANGDTANKIGTYTIAVLAKSHQVPFYVAAPRSTFDLNTPDGSAIPIESRSEDEVLYVWGRLDDGSLGRVRVAGEGSRAINPAFDVTPAPLINRFITEAGLVEPTTSAIAAYVGGALAEAR